MKFLSKFGVASDTATQVDNSGIFFESFKISQTLLSLVGDIEEYCFLDTGCEVANRAKIPVAFLLLHDIFYFNIVHV